MIEIEDRLKDLHPLLAAAFAVRCAMRVRPLYSHHDGDTLDAAIRIAVKICKSGRPAKDDSAAADDAAKIAAEVGRTIPSQHSDEADDTSSHALFAAVAAAEAAKVAYAGDQANSAAKAHTAYTSARTAAPDAAHIETAANADLAAMFTEHRELSIGDDGFDPTGDGPFGPLWPGSPPDWFEETPPEPQGVPPDTGSGSDGPSVEEEDDEGVVDRSKLDDFSVSGTVRHIVATSEDLAARKQSEPFLITTSCLLFAMADAAQDRAGFLATHFIAKKLSDNEKKYRKVRDSYFNANMAKIGVQEFLLSKNTVRVFTRASQIAIAVSSTETIHARHLLGALLEPRPNSYRAVLRLTQSGIDLHELRTRFLDFAKSEASDNDNAWIAIFQSQESGVPTHTDEPAAVDLLGRAAFAQVLALRILGIKQRDTSSGGGEPFLMHIHGPWGAGKSSLLNFLSDDLRSGSADANWVVIEFNAWQHQRGAEPWWILMDAIYGQALKAEGHRSWWRGIILRARESWWRFVVGWAPHVLVAAIALWGVSLTLFAMNPGGEISPGMDVKTLSLVVSLCVTVWGLTLTATRTLLPGTSRAASAFAEHSQNPTERLASHFETLIGWIKRPVAVFIDDLDRCDHEYVVKLLESIQTLYRNAGVVYVVAADRRWLYTSFETVYEKFKDSLEEPGRPIGHLFLEKIFQMSVTLPPISPDVRNEFWRRLIAVGDKEALAELQGLQDKAMEHLAGADTEQAVLDQVEAQEDGGLQAQALRQAAIVRLAEPDMQRKTEHALRLFAVFLDPNPRAMKRLVNAYGIHRAISLLAGVKIGVKQLALWTIVCLRWPALGEYLERNPGAVAYLDKAEVPDEVPKIIEPLFGQADVVSIFRGATESVDVHATLDEDVLRELAGLGPNQLRPTTVA